MIFIQTEDLQFGKPYANIKIIDIGPEASYDKVGFMRQVVPGKGMADIMPKGMKMMAQHYERGMILHIKKEYL